ncbi:Cytochrome C oxidase, cbb3-type, subunit III [Sphingobium sp. AP50]|uniref:c-type cytochrome n=1 Tax=Sphingobium sp. AP50 TaxID=1884369 RepID=UPI0008AEF42A|nr:cytochrome c [Sphingobium sp. AP50]SEJ93764.1 Cytochrome C oxidase, cbb3-type, subunit III [Sphingobium sp. AP50]
MRRGMIALSGAALILAGAACGRASEAPTEAPKGPPPLPAPETLSSRPQAAPGEKLYLEKCAMCHGPGGMGTGLLARRTEQPLLEKRTDLTADYVVQAARMGIGNMPAIPRGEVSDADLQLIAQHLAKGAKP